MFEIGGVSEEVARKAFALGAAKLPVKSKFVKRLNSDTKKGEA
jgi:large subunit ribosomal protein L16